MSRWLTFCAVVAIGNLDILIVIACGAVVIWFAQKRRQGAAA